MQDKFEQVIKSVYSQWKSDQPVDSKHPDEEELACFFENKLSSEESDKIKEHIITCENCLEKALTFISLQESRAKDVPEELLLKVRELSLGQDAGLALDIFLLLKEKTLKIINTTGDVLVGQEFVPAPVLRGRLINDFKDEVTILKDFKDIRVEARIENKSGKAFGLSITVKDKASQKTLKDLRITLIKDDVELESYISDSGKVIFEHVLLGRYSVEISGIENRIATITLDIKQ